MMQNVCLRLGSSLEYLHSFFVLLGLDVNNLGQVLESFLKMEKQQIDILKFFVHTEGFYGKHGQF